MTWSARDRLTEPAAHVLGLAVQAAAADVRLEQGRLFLADVKARVTATPVSGSGSVRLEGAWPYLGQVTSRAWDLGTPGQLSPDYRPPVKLEGRLTTTASVAGT